MMDEARNTERHGTLSGTKLGKRAMNFVSGGTDIEPDFEDYEEINSPVARSPSPVTSEASEVILFGGRNRPQRNLDLDQNSKKGSSSAFPARPLDLDSDEVDEAILADYIQNMDSDTAGDTGSKTPEPLHTDRTPEPINNSEQSLGVLDLQELNITRTITTILSQRKSSSGLDYQVVYDNQSYETAVWISSDSMENLAPSAYTYFDELGNSESSSMDSEAQAAQDLADAFDNAMFEDDVIRDKQSRMTDEQIAKRLAKQEELGLDSMEVMMFNGEEDLQDVQYLRQEARRYGSRKFQPIDAYDGFDPTVRPTKKGKQRPKFDLSDSEMENEMLMAWDNDRAKKKMRKQEREALRAQGLLGKGDMKAKYPNGMTVDQILSELRTFLKSDRETYVSSSILCH
jgi:hypothetical protein